MMINRMHENLKLYTHNLYTNLNKMIWFYLIPNRKLLVLK